MKILFFLYRFFCSIKPAVIILSALIILFALGTFYESAQGRRAAQEIIYRSVYMNFFIFLLALNIIAVMVDRWPWKKKHTGFLMAHFGILFIIAGSLGTRLYGVDGNLRLALGAEGQEIVTELPSVVVYSSFDAVNLTELYRARVFFFRHPPKVEKPFLIPLGKDMLKIQDFYPVANVREQYKSLSIPSQKEGSEERVTARNPRSGGTAVFFQIEGVRGNMARWIYKPAWKDRVEQAWGPARIVLSSSSSYPSLPSAIGKLVQKEKPVVKKISKNSLWLFPATEKKLKYELRGSRAPQEERSKKRVTAHNPRSGGTASLTYRPASSLKESQSAVIPPLVSNPRRGAFTSQKGRSEERVTVRNPRSGRPASSLKESQSAVIPPLVNNPRSGGASPQSTKTGKLQPTPLGFLKEGSVLKTGWMDFRFRLIRYLPQALPDTVFTPQKKAGDQTVSAVQVNFKGEQKWMGLNSHLYFFDKDKVYIIAYVKERKQLSFSLRLKDFKINRYPGSGKSSGYESQVQLNGEKKARLISLNKPLKKGGYTIYQSGFEEDENGIPTASIFAINKDPGRFVKYFGSLLIVLGSLVLFWGKSLRRKKG